MNNFTGKKRKCIELLAFGKLTIDSISNELGCVTSTIHKWKKDPEFMQAVVTRSQQYIRDDLPEVYNALRDKSKEGSHHHIRLLLDHLEKLEDAKAGNATISFTWKSKDAE